MLHIPKTFSSVTGPEEARQADRTRQDGEELELRVEPLIEEGCVGVKEETFPNLSVTGCPPGRHPR